MNLVDASNRAWHLRQFCFYGILALQLLAVLAFGGVEYWTVALLELAALIFLAVWGVSALLGGSIRLRRNPLYLPMLAFGLLVTLQELTGRTAYAPFTRQGLLLLAADFLLFFVLVNTVESRQQKMTLVVALVVFGAAVALFAEVQDFTSDGRIYWWLEPAQGGWVYGPYVNHNHYAGLMNMLAMLPLALVLGRAVRRDKAFLMLFVTVLMFTSVLFSGSRGGLFAFAGQLVLLAVIFFSRGQKKYVLLAVALAAGLALLTMALGLVALEKRFADADQAMGGRVTVWRDSLAAIRQHLWIGTGFGTFAVIYPRFKSTPGTLQWREAHNDYLQLLFETGVVGFLLMGWFLLRLVRHVLPLLYARDPDFGITLGASLGCFGILLHSLVDFNMQIPANAMLFFVLCALLTS